MNDVDNTRARLGQAIRQRRREMKLTQEDIAKAINKSKATISKIETGQHNLDWETIDAIAGYLDTTRFLLEWAAERSRLERDPDNHQAIQIMDQLLTRLHPEGAVSRR